MFTIIGGDGKEYGPVSVEQLRAWIAAGRANLDTKARAAGSEEWRRLGDFAEFGPQSDMPPPMMGGSTIPAQSFGTAVPIEAVAAGRELAGRGTRLGAALINGFITLLAATPGLIMMFMQVARDNPDLMSGGVTNSDDLDMSGIIVGQMWVYGAILLITVIQGILLGIRGQDLGKMALGIRVVRVDGTPAGFVRAAVLRLFVPGLISMIPLIGSLFSIVDVCFIFREDRRCLHDLIAGTKVVKG